MRILIVDDHPIVLEGIEALLTRLASETEILQARDVPEALAVVEARDDLDLVLLDLALPGMDGLSAIPEFLKRRRELPVVVLSSFEDLGHIKLALRLGAMGYVPKSTSAKTLLSALQFVLAGNIYVPPLALTETSDANPERASVERSRIERLTERHLTILRQIRDGRSNAEIARELNLSEKTVKAHITAIFKILDVVNRSQAASLARRNPF